MLAFFQAAAVWILLKAEFLAITLVLVYVGAVMVLFLFVVMMLDINLDSIRKGFWKHFPLAGAAGTIIALEMSYVLMGGFREPPQSASTVSAVGDIATQVSNTKELGKLLYSGYIYPLEVAAVILLVGMIAAIAMTLRERKDSKRTNPADQVRVKAADRIKLVKMESVLTAPVAVEEKKA